MGFFVPSPTMTKEMYNTVQTPAAAFRYLNDMGKFVTMITAPFNPFDQAMNWYLDGEFKGWGDRYKTGPNKGKLKIVGQLQRVTPGTRFIENMQEPDRMYMPYKR